MTTPLRRQTLLATAIAAAMASTLLAPAAQAAGTNTLTGWALMPAATLSDGPTSGQFAGAGAGGNALPLINQHLGAIKAPIYLYTTYHKGIKAAEIQQTVPALHP